MSYTFRVESVGVPTYTDVLGRLPAKGLRCQHDTELSGPWRVDHSHRLYVHGVSTRSIEAVLGAREFRVRIFSGASPEDYELALEVISNVAKWSMRPIISEEGVRFDVQERRRGYGRGWIDDHIRTIAKVILRMAASRRHDDPLVIDGPIRRFHVGPKVSARITDAGQTDLDRAERLIEAIRLLQYPDIPFAPADASRLPDSETLVSSSPLAPNTPCLMERVDVVEVMSDAPAHVPWEHLDVLLGPYVRWADEWTAQIGSVPESAWEAVLTRAGDLENSGTVIQSDLTQNTWWSTQVTDAPTEIFAAPSPRETDTQDDTGVRRWWDVWRQRR